MAVVSQLDIRYSPEHDILAAHIPPRRRMKMGWGRHGFLIGYDWECESEIVGFEILDFSTFVSHLHELGVLPELNTRFDVQQTTVRVDPDGTVHRETQDTGLRGLTLTEVLEWAYHTFILARVPGLLAVEQTRVLVPA